MSLIIPFFIEYDKTQAEWVVVAYESNDQNMIKAVEEGLDVHAWTAHLMSGVPIDEIMLEDKALDKSTSETQIASSRRSLVFPRTPALARATWIPRNMALRQAGKKANHALNYGEGPILFAKTNGLSLTDARELIRRYHQAYPGIARWHAELEFKLKAIDPTQRCFKRTLTNCFGREMMFLGPLSGSKKDATMRQAYCCIPQSTVADIASNAMVAVDAKMAGRVRLVSNNHDSILVQHYLDRDALLSLNAGPSEVSKIVREMQEIYSYLNPTLTSTMTGKTYQIKTDSKIGRNWGRLEKVYPDVNNVREALHKIVRSVKWIVS